VLALFVTTIAWRAREVFDAIEAEGISDLGALDTATTEPLAELRAELKAVVLSPLFELLDGLGVVYYELLPNTNDPRTNDLFGPESALGKAAYARIFGVTAQDLDRLHAILTNGPRSLQAREAELLAALASLHPAGRPQAR
jgi:hypothetical protein